jgi:hypothetical protein
VPNVQTNGSSESNGTSICLHDCTASITGAANAKTNSTANKQSSPQAQASRRSFVCRSIRSHCSLVESNRSDRPWALTLITSAASPFP